MLAAVVPGVSPSNASTFVSPHSPLEGTVAHQCPPDGLLCSLHSGKQSMQRWVLVSEWCCITTHKCVMLMERYNPKKLIDHSNHFRHMLRFCHLLSTYLFAFGMGKLLPAGPGEHWREWAGVEGTRNPWAAPPTEPHLPSHQ